MILSFPPSHTHTHTYTQQKEVERRRRETINEGINELKTIVPNCDKNKGSILKQAVKYINELKQAESTNIEKWTLEKLLNDQAMQGVRVELEGWRNVAEERERERDLAREEVWRLRGLVRELGGVGGDVVGVEEEVGGGGTHKRLAEGVLSEVEVKRRKI